MPGTEETGPGELTADVVRRVSDLQRLRGPLRITTRQTKDGLGVFVPPARRFGPVAFLCAWLCGWSAGEFFALDQLINGNNFVGSIFILVWLLPWTVAGLGCLWVIGWQLFGVERLFFTAGALVREWRLLGVSGRRVIPATEITSVKVDGKATDDLAGLGAIKVETTGRSMRIGSGLPVYEAELVADLIRSALLDQRSHGVVEPPVDPDAIRAAGVIEAEHSLRF